MTLGTFGGSSPDTRPGRSGGGGVNGSASLLDDARSVQAPSPEGIGALSGQLYLPGANYGQNLIKNGGFESYPNGTGSVPDAWTLTGAGATVAKNTTTVYERIVAVDLTAALDTATDLGQAITVSATVNAGYRGAVVTFCAQVKCATAARAFLRVEDGVGTTDSRLHTGSGAYETIFVTRTIDAAATKVEVSCEISSGASITATFDAAILVMGQTPVAFSAHLNDEYVRFTNRQNSVGPTDETDHGVIRIEIGEVSIAGITTVAVLAQTVTFQTAFNKILGVVISASTADSKVGATRGMWSATDHANSTFIARHATDGGGNYGSTAAGSAQWQAWGSV